MLKDRCIMQLKTHVGIALLYVCVFAFSNQACASIESDLKKTFDSLNMSSNISGPGAYEDQRGGYYTGGSISARGPVKSTDIVNIQMPSYRSGCGGIDLYAGGISYLKAKELIATLKAAIPGAAGYGFALAMQTMTPQLYNVLTELQEWAQKINSMNINSCEVAVLGIGSLWPKSDAASKYMCSVLGTSSGQVEDWVQARHSCGDDQSRSRINSSQHSHEGFKDQLGEEFNLVWKAIKKNSFLTSNDVLAEFFMSISGTIVSRKGSKNPIRFPSLLNNHDLIKMLIHGQSVEISANIYSCDGKEENKCLYLSEKKFVLTKDNALMNKISNILASIARKVRENEKASAEEQGLINSTGIPILKIVAIQSAFKEGASPITLTEYAEPIAYDILLLYLDSILDLVFLSLKELQQVQINDTVINPFTSEIREVRRKIFEQRNSLFQSLTTQLAAMERIKLIENQMQHTFAKTSNLEEE